MNSPGITRGRRPFLTPIWFAALSVLLATAVLFWVVRAAISVAGETTTLIVLRHAETEAEMSNADRPLSEAGRQRAEQLAALLAASEPQAVWVSDTLRARQTAEPLARRLALTPQIYDPRTLEDTLQRLGEDHAGEKIVLIGHSNTLPPLIERLTRGQYRLTWSEDSHDRLLIVTVTRFGPPSVTELRF